MRLSLPPMEARWFTVLTDAALEKKSLRGLTQVSILFTTVWKATRTMRILRKGS